MFFRREKQQVATFDERLRRMEQLGIRAAKKGDDKAVVMRGTCAAVVRESAGEYTVDPVGFVVGNEIGELVDGGNQKYWLTPSGKREPSTAEQLQALHAFVEDVRECCGLTSLYNEGLGSVNAHHFYDRVEDRDHGRRRKPWEKATA
jgi:hypothetical protein